MTRRDRIASILAGAPLDPTRLRKASLAATMADARWAAQQVGLRGVEGERALLRHRARLAVGPRRDALAEREPGYMAVRHAHECFERAYDRAGYRGAKHAHQTLLTMLDLLDSAPTVRSEGGQLGASKAGLPNAYAKKGYSVATSLHAIAAPKSWLREVYLRGAAVVGGRLVLELSQEADPGGAYRASWVEQGRGTAIRLETGWVVETASGWAFARKRRAA